MIFQVHLPKALRCTQMNKFSNQKRLVYIKVSGTILSALSLVLILYAYSDKINNKRNGFTRTFLKYSPVQKSVLKTDEKVLSIAGVTQDDIYLGTTEPGSILVVGANLKKKRIIDLNLKRFSKISVPIFSRCYIDSPTIYVFTGNIPAVINGNLNDKQVAIHYLNNKAKYNQAVPISPNTIVCRGVDTNNIFSRIFIKHNLLNQTFTVENNISEKINDGGLSSDGLLHYDNSTKLLIYVNYYQNKFICIDTNLHLVYNGNTIDTTKTPQIQVGIFSKGKVTQIKKTSPSVFVNGYSCVDNGFLYIHSNLKADNEKMTNFTGNSVIDIYQLTTGKYVGSYYIPLYKGEKLRTFRVYNKLIYVQYKNYLVCYDIN